MCRTQTSLGCHDNEAPRREMSEKVVDGSRGSVCAVPPGDDRVQEAAKTKIRRILEIEFIAEGIAAPEAGLRRHAPGTRGVILKLDAAGRIVGWIAGPERQADSEYGGCREKSLEGVFHFRSRGKEVWDAGECAAFRMGVLAFCLCSVFSVEFVTGDSERARATHARVP